MKKRLLILDVKLLIILVSFVLKKYSVLAYGCTIVTGNHTPTVGIPLSRLVHSHINDVEKDIIVEEDVWCGANVTMLSGAHIGRGAVLVLILWLINLYLHTQLL